LDDQELMTVTARHYDDAVDSPQGTPPVDDGPTYLGGDDVDLTSDPFADDLADELEASAPRPAATRTTLALSAAVLIVAGFIGGVLVQKNYGTNNSGANAAANALASFAARGGFGNGGGGGGFGNGGGGGGSTTTGTIKLVDGTTIYITTADGSVVTVKTSSTTTVQATVPLTSLKAGATVSVTGTTGSDGTVTATRVTQTK
jgi:hypothetical protein